MNDKIYCMHCGALNNKSDRFCIKCGQPLHPQQAEGKASDQQANAHRSENIFQSATRTINNWTGEDKSVHINLASFFSQVWRRHTEAEAENIFIAGTHNTTPSLAEVSSKPVQPWLYSRVFLGMMLAVILLYVLTTVLGSALQLAFLSALSISVPVSLLVFFFEVNVFKNISLYLAVKICLIGGLFSLIVTMLIYGILGTNPQFDLLGALTIGFIEETGKLLVGAYFVSKLRLTHVFNGMLVGGAIGAGFAAFENLQYLQQYLSMGVAIAFTRAFSSLGTHAIWCAIAVAGLVLVNGNRKLAFANVANLSFFRFFLCAVVLHGLWDWDTPMADLKMVVLVCAGWLVLLILIHTGLREVKFIQNQLSENQKFDKQG